MNYKKRTLILILLIVSLLAWFWLGSRYPAIDEKAAMAGEVVMGDVLSFEAHFPVDPSAPMWRKILHSTLNWILTNRQGMTFGVLLATLVLTLLQLQSKLSRFRSVFRDIVKGVVIGAPLGVCVNCAAPIAYGMRQQGMRKGTTLATMFASPTLNIIVLAMTFSLLPLHMAVTKVIATFIFLLLLLPILVRFADRDKKLDDLVPEMQGGLCEVPSGPESWADALPRLIRELWRNFLFIVIRTVPLMFLAGLLGAAMANLIPLESMANSQVTMATMALVALLGTFAPVPIAFDIVLVQALLVAGLQPEFAMVLLFTLGAFSIYPLMLVAKMFSWRFSFTLFLAVALFGIATGYFAGGWDSYQANREARIYEKQFSNSDQSDGRTGDADRAVEDVAASILPQNSPNAPKGERVYQQGPVSLDALTHRPRSSAALAPFEHVAGKQVGLANPEPQLLDFMLPFSQGRGLAAGDFNGDGWPDLAVANNQGIQLYRNAGGSRFEEIPVNAPRLQAASVLLVAFVDLDNDGCLDLFAGTFGDNDFIVAGNCHDFERPRLVYLPHLEGLMTQAAAFADIDKDGNLDILKSNWFFLIPRVAPSQRAVNYVVMNQGGFQFTQEPLDEIVGETLTAYLSDLDQDGNVDMIIGNDYLEPVIYYQGVSSGKFRQLSAGGPVPVTALATMSIDAADIDNDLDLDLFLSGKVNDFSMRRGGNAESGSIEERRAFVIQRRKDFEKRYCELFETPVDRKICINRFSLGNLLRSSNIDGCLELETKRQQDECMITIRIRKSLIRRNWAFCPEIPAEEFPVHRQLCDAYAGYEEVAQPKELGDRYLDQGAIEQTMQGNVLLLQQADGSYTQQAEGLGVFDVHWAWTARFADLDLDEWQDLFVTNGWWLETSMYSNKFFQNQAGKGFKAQEQEFGLVNLRKQNAFVLLDMDRDGDLDIISRSLGGEFDAYLNHQQDKQAISFEFRDQQSNHFGIGNRITLYYGQDEEGHQMREITAGGGFVSFNPPAAYFGLGQHGGIGRVRIDWNDGAYSTIEMPLQAGYHYIVRRASPSLVEESEQ